jgi:hypothetical protein
MATHRLLSRLLVALILSVAILPAPLRAQESCPSIDLASYERAFIQAHGQRFDASAMSEADAVPSYDRAFMQAHGERLFDVACESCATDVADSTMSFERALIQAQDHVMVSTVRASCVVVA